MKKASQQAKYGSARHLAAKYGVHVNTIWRWSRTGVIPQPRISGPQLKRWNLEEVDAALSQAA